MKKIRICMFAMLFAMSLFALAGCSSNKNQDNTQSSSASRQETSSAATNGTSGTEGSTSAGNGTSESKRGNESSSSRESTGVLDELGDDMEQGMDDLLDGPGTTSASGESK